MSRVHRLLFHAGLDAQATSSEVSCHAKLCLLHSGAMAPALTPALLRAAMIPLVPTLMAP